MKQSNKSNSNKFLLISSRIRKLGTSKTKYAATPLEIPRKCSYHLGIIRTIIFFFFLLPFSKSKSRKIDNLDRSLFITYPYFFIPTWSNPYRFPILSVKQPKDSLFVTRSYLKIKKLFVFYYFYYIEYRENRIEKKKRNIVIK